MTLPARYRPRSLLRAPQRTVQAPAPTAAVLTLDSLAVRWGLDDPKVTREAVRLRVKRRIKRLGIKGDGAGRNPIFLLEHVEAQERRHLKRK